jgi:hypothetical protein
MRRETTRVPFLHIVLYQVRLDELGECEPVCDPSLPSKPLERVTRILLRSESTSLHTLRVAAAGPVSVRPQTFAV